MISGKGTSAGTGAERENPLIAVTEKARMPCARQITRGAETWRTAEKAEGRAARMHRAIEAIVGEGLRVLLRRAGGCWTTATHDQSDFMTSGISTGSFPCTDHGRTLAKRTRPV